MGCGESKIKNINLAPENEKDGGHIEMTKKGTSSEYPSEADKSKLVSDEGLPNRLLSAIPISDLGESLDSRHLSESFNGGNKFSKGNDLSNFFSKIYFFIFIKPFKYVSDNCKTNVLQTITYKSAVYFTN